MDVQMVVTSVVTAIVITALTAICRQLQSIKEDFAAVKAGTRAGLLADITRIHSGSKKNGRISGDTFRIVMECYAQYKALGGDGFADSLIHEIAGLATATKQAAETAMTVTGADKGATAAIK